MSTNYKTSRYTFTLESNDKYYLYNSLSNVLVEVDKELFDIVSRSKEQCETISSISDTSILESLRKDKIITNNDEDDFLLYKSIIQGYRNDRRKLMITIAPTMDCCFNCHYCFERTKRPSYMSGDVMHGIAKFLATFNDAKSVGITWFGGEPLMAVPEMEKLYTILKRKLKGLTFSSSIITTGFHLNEENIKALQKIKVSNMQITLDGLKNTHNKIKYTNGCNDAFSVVMDNIDRLCEIAPDIMVFIRVNITKSNMHEFDALQEYVCKRFSNKVAIQPAFVLNRNSDDSAAENNLISYKNQSQCILNLSKSDRVSSYAVFPGYSISECAIRNPYSFSFDPDGYVYKCWEHIGDTKYAVGKVNKKGEFAVSNVMLMNRQLYGADPLEDSNCRKCSILPICSGGCPIQRIENLFDNENNVCCSYYKGHIQEFLLEFIKKRQLKKVINQ